ncbi:hypothetical protein [Rhizorhapis suberifaciens]|uniref:Uncharacterized protein n=1 Tax=Rhizorhapis suberifaciens TaxID=13656 RepID=A0A840HXV0_9SPHN|nr:hypothetical protein [Rhizorhapis suberifaciens]MBB4642389.1 hypothetical protein [Rhizorhapis suberifaciens]
MEKEEFCKRFVTHMIDKASFDHFDDGTMVLDYAEETAQTYWETDWQREMGPEECADADMSYWGDS